MPSVNDPDAATTTSMRYDLPGGAHVLFTSRAHANLSTQTGEEHERGRAARDRLCEQLGLDWLCASRQVHGSTVQRVRETAGSRGEAVAIDADGHATALAGVGAMVLTADCLPVALGAETDGGGVVAMAHAGWRGLAAGVLEEAVRALRELGATGPIEAVVGPCAGVCCYEVGEEVHAAFADQAGPDGAGRMAEDYRRGKNIDLRAIARDKLLAAGVANVSHAEACTICDERFFSHRRQGKAAGRQAGIAWVA
jgi:polyphenol oxidase